LSVDSEGWSTGSERVALAVSYRFSYYMFSSEEQEACLGLFRCFLLSGSVALSGQSFGDDILVVVLYILLACLCGSSVEGFFRAYHVHQVECEKGEPEGWIVIVLVTGRLGYNFPVELKG
jgi:hypothetical protein